MPGRTYRYFQGDALVPFGFVLSYNTFTLSQPTYNNRTITVDVKNTGHRAGAETIQAYIKKINDKDGPIKTLRAFEKVTLQPGESKTLNLYLNEQDLEWWDASTNTMRFQPGEYDVWVGTSSQTSDLKKLSLKF
jgi:beta-glucosidase